jgi:hypothetical protein
MFEGSVIALMKVNNDGQYFTEAHAIRFVAPGKSGRNPLFAPLWLKLFAKFVNDVE